MWSESKLEVEFQYGRRLFFQTRSSYNVDVACAITTKFGLLIEIDFSKRNDIARS